MRQAFEAVAALYSALFMVSLVQLIRICQRYRAWTMQKYVHVLVVVVTFLRAALLILTGLFDWCGISEGSLDPGCGKVQREAFYVLDQAPSLVFFSLCSLLVVYWADVYYHAIDQVHMVQVAIKPFARWINGLVYAVQMIIWGLYVVEWTHERHFVTKAYAAFTTANFILMCASFLHFGRLAYRELR